MSLQANAAVLAFAQKTDPDAYELPVDDSKKEGVSNPDGLVVSDTMKKVWVVEAKTTPRVCARLFATL